MWLPKQSVLVVLVGRQGSGARSGLAHPGCPLCFLKQGIYHQETPGAGRRGWGAVARHSQHSILGCGECGSTRQAHDRLGTACVRGDRAGLDTHPKQTRLSLKNVREGSSAAVTSYVFQSGRGEEKLSHLEIIISFVETVTEQGETTGIRKMDTRNLENRILAQKWI